MIWEFGVFFLSLLNLAALWLVFNYPDQAFWIVGIFAAALLIGVRLIARNFRFFLLLALLTVGVLLLLPLIDSPAQAKAFIFLMSGVFYLVALAGYRLRKYDKDQTAKAMVNLAALATLFCWYTSVYGWYLNVEVSVWYIMAVFAVITFLVSYILIMINKLEINRSQRVLYSIFLAYLMAGAIWIQNSWPFGYLTTGVITLIIYYVSWDIIRNYFTEKLTARKIVFNLFFLAGTVSILLLSTRWYPII
jgi:predicted membrane channel-forming protein YqfA (hemolysin III family)